MKTVMKLLHEKRAGWLYMFFLGLLSASALSFTLSGTFKQGPGVEGIFDAEIAEDCCAEVGKPDIMIFSYLRENCSGTNVASPQANGQSDCNSNDSLPPTVEIFVFSGSSTLVTLFQGLVSENETFIVNANGVTANGKFGPNTVIQIHDTSTTQVIQAIKLHTSCSEPLSAGDQYGSIVIQGTESNAGTCGSIGVFDWGDAPDNYATTDTFNGPYHLLTLDGPFLGASSPDPEEVANTSFLGDGDDGEESNDEDGYVLTPLIENKNALISIKYENPSQDSAFLGAWFDLDGDGQFDDGEYQFFAIDSMAGDTVTLDFGLIPDTDLLSTFLRIRISTSKSAVANPTGPAPDGEIEDHLIMIQQAVLPIELASFDAKLVGEQTEVTWTTLSEINNAYFVVERSTDGVQFSSIGKLDSKGNTSTKTSYELIDPKPVLGVNYYRLLQMDHDGSSSHSKVISITLISKPINNSTVYPNPLTNHLNLQLADDLSGMINYQILDITGRKHLQFTSVDLVDRDILSFDVAVLGVGLYYLKVVAVNRIEIIPFQKL